MALALVGCVAVEPPTNNPSEELVRYPLIQLPEQLLATNSGESGYNITFTDVSHTATSVTLPFSEELGIADDAPYILYFIPTQNAVEIRLENTGSNLGWLVSFDSTSDPAISQVDAGGIVVYHLEGVYGEKQFVRVLPSRGTIFNGIITITQP